MGPPEPQQLRLPTGGWWGPPVRGTSPRHPPSACRDPLTPPLSPTRVRPAAAATRPGRPLGSEVQPVRGLRTTATPSAPPPPPAAPMLAQQVMEDDVKGERVPRRCPAQVTSPSPRVATPEGP